MWEWNKGWTLERRQGLRGPPATTLETGEQCGEAPRNDKVSSDFKKSPRRVTVPATILSTFQVVILTAIP